MRIGLFGLAPGIEPFGYEVQPGFFPGERLDQIIAGIRQAEADGFASFWAAHLFEHDAIMVLALAGQSTRTIELGVAITPTYPRHPTALAQQALTAQAATGGRFTLGIGLSHKLIMEGMYGFDFSKPVRHMREYLTVLNGLLGGEPVKFAGEEYRVAAQVAVAGATRPPVLVAALGPQMLRLTGRLADGTITWMGGPKYHADTVVPLITKAAQEAGRPAPRIAAGAPIAVTNQAAAARAAAGNTFQFYATLPSYRAVLGREGAAGPADVAIVGDEGEVGQQLARLADAGVTDFVGAPYRVAGDPEARQRTYEFLAKLAKS